MSSSSSSSEDEANLDLLREAADSEFMKDSLYKGTSVKVFIFIRVYNLIFLDSKNGVKTKDLSEEKPKSLRKIYDEDEQFNFLKVTPGFQHHIAKRLSSYLEERLSKKMSKVEDDLPANYHKRNCGIKLFKNSSDYINNIEQSSGVTVKVRRKERNKRKVESDCDTSSEDEDSKVRKVAVSATQILNGSETKHWSNRSKAEVFRYRKTKTGQLISVNDKN